MKLKLILILCLGLSFGCKKTDVAAEEDAQTEMAQNVGDAMASVDESGGSGSGAIANYRAAAEKTFARLAPEETQLSIAKYLLPNAEATACDGFGFSSCSAGVITRTFNGCTVGTATFSGTVTLTWAGGGSTSSCILGTNGDTITRSPSFVVTGRRGATLHVSKTGTIGQRLTRMGAGVFDFTNDGINRKFTTQLGATIFDQTAVVSSPITVSGSSRANRTMNGGVLHVTNNLTSVSCDYVPTNLVWVAGCNCPTSGSWAGTCSNSNTGTLTITGCGTANFTDGTYSGSLTFDRCGG